MNLGDIVLRRFEPKDIESLYRFRNDHAITRALTGFATGYSRQDLTDWMEWHRKQSDEELWAIAAADDDRCIGHVGLYAIDRRSRKAEFGIIIGDSDWQGKRVGPRVSNAVIDFAFDQLNLRRIHIRIHKINERSLVSYEKLGFVREGVLREDYYRDGRYHDVVLLSLLDSDPRPTEQVRQR